MNKLMELVDELIYKNPQRRSPLEDYPIHKKLIRFGLLLYWRKTGYRYDMWKDYTTKQLWNLTNSSMWYWCSVGPMDEQTCPHRNVR